LAIGGNCGTDHDALKDSSDRGALIAARTVSEDSVVNRRVGSSNLARRAIPPPESESLAQHVTVLSLESTYFANVRAVRRRFSGPLYRGMHCNALHLIRVRPFEIRSDFQSCRHWPANGQQLFSVRW
jgi:hypothetical protein